ncbi:MAG: beta-lactamase family protein [Propionibacteriaceae bacterium]|jgi:CubicO group peptidase (beta-lactamase class C family)|nr:beta-lactamase family protein [Propionibacteriaceae bacterium]
MRVDGALDFTHVSTPETVGVDSAGVAAFVAGVTADPFIDPHTLLLARDGVLIARGGWAPYRPDQPTLLYSLSKSFAITGLGIAVDEGLLRLDEPVLGAFPECDDDAVPDATRRITFRHLAMMGSGHAQEMWPLLRSNNPAGLFRAFFHVPPDREPGTLFTYNQFATYSIVETIHRRSGARFLDWLRPRLFDPLGVTAAGWQQLVPGIDLGFTGLFTTPDAVAALAQLYLNKGVYAGRRIVSERWVDEATRAQIDNSHWSPDPDWQQGYGFHFWMCQHGYRGDGAFGQYCLVLPEQRMIVAFTSQTLAMQRVLNLVYEHLLPAVDRGTSSGATPVTEHDENNETMAFDPFAGKTAALPTVAGAADPTATQSFAPVTPHTQVAGGVEIDFTPAAPELATLELVDGVGTVRISDATVDITAPVRIGAWMTTERGPSCPIAVAAAAACDAETARVSLLFLETPHRIELSWDRATGDCHADWVTPALLGAGLRDLGYPD